MDPVSIGKIIELSLSILDKLADKIPDFDQRRKKELKKLKARYIQEANSEMRDMDLIRDLKDEILLLLETWDKELTS